MKRLALVRVKACARCRRAIAFLKSEDGEHALGLPIELDKARELLSRYQASGVEKFLADLLLRLLARSPSALRQVVLDCNKGGFLSATVDTALDGKTESFSCSPEEGLGLAIAAEIPLYAAERIFEDRHLFHPLETESEESAPPQSKPRPPLH